MKFSLVIPLGSGRNAEILKSIQNLDYQKKEFEVLVERGTNPSENRNRGIEKAKGNFIVFLDDDAFIEKDYLKKIEKFFKEYPNTDFVGGPQLTPKKGENFFARLSGIVLTSNFGAFKVNKRYLQNSKVYEAEQTDLTSANFCVKKNVFEKISGFDKTLYPGEDPELINRAKKQGMKIYYNPEMIIFHKRRNNFSKYMLQIFKYGLVRPKVNKSSEESKVLFLIPMFFLIYFLFLPILLLISPLLGVPFLVYISLAIIFGILDSIKNKTFVGIFVLPFLYLFTHLSYGIGVLSGYLRK